MDVMWLFMVLTMVFGLTMFDQGDVGAALRRTLVQTPARLLAKLSRGQIIGLMLVLVLVTAVAVVFEADGLRLMSMAAPDLIAWVLMFDVTVLFDLAVLAVSLRAIAGWRGLTQAATVLRKNTMPLIQRIAAWRGRQTRRPHRPRPPRPKADDAEPGLVFA